MNPEAKLLQITVLTKKLVSLGRSDHEPLASEAFAKIQMRKHTLQPQLLEKT